MYVLYFSQRNARHKLPDLSHSEPAAVHWKLWKPSKCAANEPEGTQQAKHQRKFATDILRGLILLCTVAYCFGSPRISISPHDWNMPQSNSFKFNMFWRGRGAYLWVTVSRERPHETPQGREAEKRTFLNSTWIHSSPASFFVLVLSHVLKTRYTVTGCTFTFLTSKTGESGRFGPNLDMDNFMNEECYETISPSNVS